MKTVRAPGFAWRAILVLIALLMLLIGYYWDHKPLDFSLLLALGGAFVDLVTVSMIAAVAAGIGRRVLNRLPVLDALSSAERVALQCGLGLGMISTLVLIIGMLGGLNWAVLWALMIALAAVAFRSMLSWLADVRNLARSIRPATRWDCFLALFVALALTLALARALAPPTAWDALMYHLVGPQMYLDQGRIVAHPQNHYLGFPQGVESLFTLATALWGRDTAAAPLHFLFGLLALLSAGGLLRRYADPSAAWMALALLLSSYSVWMLLGWPYVDMAVMAYALMALSVLMVWRESQDDRLWIVAGVLAGLMLAVKYTSGVFLIALGAAALYAAPRRIVRIGFILGISALIVFLPWMVRGIVLYQNPVYPFFFGGLNWNAQREAAFQFAGQGLLSSPDAWQLAVLPIAATIFGVEKGPGFSFTSGPWLLTLPILLIVGWRWLDERSRSLAATCLLLLGVLLIFWILLASRFVLAMTPRQMMPLLSVAAAAGALGFSNLARWPRKPFDLAFVARGIVGFTLVLGLLEMIQTTERSRVFSYLAASIDRNAYAEAEIGLYANAMRQLETLPSGTKVRFLWEPRAYYCPPALSCLADVMTDFWPYALRSGKLPDEIFADWKNRGDEYLLVFDLGLEFFSSQDTHYAVENQQFPAALARWATRVWSDEFAYSLYRLDGD